MPDRVTATASVATATPGRYAKQLLTEYHPSRVARGSDTIMRSVTVTGGAAPGRAYLGDLLPDMLDGTIDPGRAFTAPFASTRCRTGTAPWPTGRRSVLINP